VVPIGKYAPAPARDPIDRAREPRTDRHHASSERVAVACLDDQMRVISL